MLLNPDSCRSSLYGERFSLSTKRLTPFLALLLQGGTSARSCLRHILKRRQDLRGVALRRSPGTGGTARRPRVKRRIVMDGIHS